MFSLKEQVALVTGASRGIGRAVAEALAAQGAFVIGTATSESGAAAIGEYLGDQGTGMMLNVADAESVTHVLNEIQSVHGGVDVLVNNAGITKDNLLMRMKEDDWDAVLNTNLTSVFRTSKGVMRGMMKKRNGRIINIGS